MIIEKSAEVIDSYHEDCVHDISFDYYSKRLATSSSDSYVKIWEKNQNNNWEQTGVFKAHNGPV